MKDYIKWFSEISIKDIPLVGGKTASLGEMYQSLTANGIRIPTGFAVTADAYSELMKNRELENRIFPLLEKLDHANVSELAKVGNIIRSLIRDGGLPDPVSRQIEAAYDRLCNEADLLNVDVAVRSSATAEDLPEASFAGQQETFLNIQGKQDLLTACLNCFASLFTDRAISYRMHDGFAHDQVRLSVCVQRMVRSDLGSAGVIFTLDTETGNRNVVFITSSYGLGENVVAGKVDPDEFLVHKTLLANANYPILRKRLGKKQLNRPGIPRGSDS